MKPLKGNQNQCTVCNERFNSNFPFDLHRIGQHGVNRRCMTKEEMLAAGMSVNAGGFWISETKEQRKRRSRGYIDAQEGTGTV
jgi:hypothetical protein